MLASTYEYLPSSPFLEEMDLQGKHQADVKVVGHPVAESGMEKDVSNTPEAFEMDPAEERRLLRKLDWNIFPTLFVVYTMAYLDVSFPFGSLKFF